MTRLIDLWLPWLADLLELGGPIVVLILAIAAVMWALLLERVWFFWVRYPQMLEAQRAVWMGRGDQVSWYARQYRHGVVHQLRHALGRNFPIVRTLIKVCPLLGLLGTVLGMLEVFDALAATGSNNPRSMAAGVSKATVSTLAGMVVAIVGLLGVTVMERQMMGAQGRLQTLFSGRYGGDSDATVS